MVVRLPTARGDLEELHLAPPAALSPSSHVPTSRRVFAAAHVVPDPLVSGRDLPGAVDWDATLALRHDLWGMGLGVAESMDTAQRGMGLTAATAMELARRSMAADPRGGAGVAVGVQTDDLDDPSPSLPQISDAYRRQVDVVLAGGGTPVLMASRHLARVATGPEDYLRVYREVIAHSGRPVLLHWLGTAFDPSLEGYWGSGDPDVAMATVVDLVASSRGAVSGIKVSLLDPVLEIRLRDLLPEGVDLFTGDDFHYTDMIAGDGHRHSHALLGAFAALGPWASTAFARLDAGDEAGFRSVLQPTETLSRRVFEAPTRYYKTGVAWLSFLAGRQRHFRMLDGMEASRSVLHLAEVTRAAAAIGYFPDPALTERRLAGYLELQGVG